MRTPAAIQVHPLRGASVLLCGATGGIGTSLAHQRGRRGGVRLRAAELPTDAMEILLQTNALVPMMVAGRALTVLRPGGAIVNISGVIAEQNLPGMSAYSASKAAVRAFDHALAREARRSKVRVIDARPPHTDTGLAGRPIAGLAPKMGQGIAPEHVARVICNALEQGTKDLPSDRILMVHA